MTLWSIAVEGDNHRISRSRPVTLVTTPVTVVTSQERTRATTAAHNDISKSQESHSPSPFSGSGTRFSAAPMEALALGEGEAAGVL